MNSRPQPHKHGIIIEVPEGLELSQVFIHWRPRQDEEIVIGNFNDFPAVFEKDVMWVKIRKLCRYPDHTISDCETRLPIVLEGHIYPIVRWDEWLEKYAR